MSYLGYSKNDLVRLGAIHTATEISHQPEVWQKVYKSISENEEKIKNFIERFNASKVILTGAGTSAFIGESLVGSWTNNIHSNTVSVSTTHIVSHPNDYITSQDDLLLVSFARSGNSPESLATVKIADKIARSCAHIIITCNPEGELVKYHSNSLRLKFLLPDEANDKSLAMTSSYSGMLLAGLLISRVKEIQNLKPQIETLVSYANNVLTNFTNLLKQISYLNFKRVVFLGSGPLIGSANESHLKVQEMTDGEIICKHDSFLGFRHGPKAVVNEDTLIVYLFTNQEYANKYEYDLVFAMENGKKPLKTVGVFEQEDYQFPIDYAIHLCSDGNTKLDESFLPVIFILPSQILAFYKSIELGLMPDTPSKSGAIHRVVQGVNIYEY